MANHDLRWSTMIKHNKTLSNMIKPSQISSTLLNNSQIWSTMPNHMVKHGRLWPNIVKYYQIMVNYGKPWSTVVNMLWLKLLALRKIRYDSEFYTERFFKFSNNGFQRQRKHGWRHLSSAKDSKVSRGSFKNIKRRSSVKDWRSYDYN